MFISNPINSMKRMTRSETREAEKRMRLKIQKLEIEPTVRQEANFAALPNDIKLRIVSNLIKATFGEYEKHINNLFGMMAFLTIRHLVPKIIPQIALLNKSCYAFINHPENMQEIIKTIDRTCWHWHGAGVFCIKKIGDGKVKISEEDKSEDKKGMPVFRNPEFTALLEKWNKQNVTELELAYTAKNSVASSAKDPANVQKAYDIFTRLLDENAVLPAGQKLNVNRRMNDGKTALLAITNVTKPSDNVFAIAKKLLDAGVDVNMLDSSKRNALFYVLFWDFDCPHKIPLIKELLAKGADLTVRDKYDESSFHTAMKADLYSRIAQENNRILPPERMQHDQEITTIVLNHVKDRHIQLPDDLKELYEKHVAESAH